VSALHVDASVSERIALACSMLGDLAETDVPLAPLTTYKVGGAAALFTRPRHIDDLDRIGAAATAAGLPTLVVGRGSNLLVADRGFDGIAISLANLGAAHRIEGSDVVAGAMVALPQLARQVVAASLSGFEWAVGVPGSMGGAVRMNAGGHGGDIAGCLVEALIVDLRTGARGWLSPDRLGLRFRGSDLAGHQVVVEARIRLRAGDRAASEAELDDIVRWRREHQPGGQNAGSVFINPIPGELSAGELIDRVGLRGLVHRTASVSTKHANFIQGSEGGRAVDVVELIDLVRRRVADETGFVLRSEVRLVGFEGVPVDESPGVVV